MKKLLMVSIFFALAIVVPMPTMAGIDIHARFSLLPLIVFEAPPEVIAMPDTGGVYVVADADRPEVGTTGRDEKQQGQPLEKGKTTGAEDKTEWKINTWPVKPPDNVKSGPQMKDENKYTPPDR